MIEFTQFQQLSCTIWWQLKQIKISKTFIHVG